MFITETERTGPVVRVWVTAEPNGDVDDITTRALDLARESLGTDALADVVTHFGVGLVEVIFEAGDLA